MVNEWDSVITQVKISRFFLQQKLETKLKPLLVFGFCDQVGCWLCVGCWVLLKLLYYNTCGHKSYISDIYR